jgi:alginate O-acetyltransferase complex protein AlgI
MLFNSFQFLIFFPVVTILFFLIPYRYRWSLLLTASCVFYMAFVPYYIFILFFTIVVDYFAGILLENEKNKKKKKLLLLMSLVANIGILAVFKYYNFINTNFTELLHLFDVNNPVPYLHIVLPIGLSFHTFQAMSYTIEVYKGKFKAERHFGIYALYVMFYPQLVAGPIERPQNILPQLHSKQNFDSARIIDGLRLMLWGFVKKIVIADRLTIYVDEVFRHPNDFHNLNLIIAVYLFSFQIYCDFSGYTDIAIGAARVMGIDLMQNFGRPYFAADIREFWSKWHMSLSTWFRDYLYIPLGGNRVSFRRNCFNIAIVFLLSGLWHGANWTFIIWGAIHGVYIILHILSDKYLLSKKSYQNGWKKWIHVLITFHLVAFAWIFFRAESLSKAMMVIKGIFSFNNPHSFSLSVGSFGMFSLAIALTSVFFMMLFEYFTSYDLRELKEKRTIVFSSLCIILIVSLGIFSGQNFIYFQF